jgi:hypothetical protein
VEFLERCGLPLFMLGGMTGMTRIVSIALLLAGTAGCTTTVRSTGSVPYPRDGIHLLFSRDGHLIQKTEWRHDKLVAAWEYNVLCREVMDALDRDGRDWPAPRWLQVVRRGNGRITFLDADGHNIGFADYHEGQYYRGAH